MSIATQLSVIFAFGLVIAGIVFLGLVRAREMAEGSVRSDATTREE